MKWQRYVISSPGVSTSTMKAVICLRSRAFHHFRWRLRHDHEHAGFDQPLVHQSFSPLRMKAEPSSVGSARKLMFAGSEPAFDLRQREGGDFLARDPRQIFPLLLFRAEKQQRLRHADRLVRGNERGQIRIPTAEQHRGAAIIDLRQTKPAVFLRDFDAERAHREKVVDVLLRNFAGAIDLVGIDVRRRR